MTETLFERETSGMTPLEVYEQTQSRLRFELKRREHGSLGGWTAKDMLDGRVCAWNRNGDAWTTAWFAGFEVRLEAPRRLPRFVEDRRGR